MDCVFCKIVSGEISSHKIYEDEHALAFLDIHPVRPGHTLVISKEHFENMSDATDKAVGHLAVLSKKLGKAIVKGTDAEAYNVSVNNGKAAGQVVPHIHFHVIPRASSDRLQSWPHADYPEGEAETVAKVIKEHME